MQLAALTINGAFKGFRFSPHLPMHQAFIQPDRAAARQALRLVADQLWDECRRLGAFIDDSQTDVLIHLNFPSQHRTGSIRRIRSSA